jgi:hypothetical protein
MCDCCGKTNTLHHIQGKYICNDCFRTHFCHICYSHVNVAGPTTFVNNTYYCNSCLHLDEEDYVEHNPDLISKLRQGIYDDNKIMLIGDNIYNETQQHIGTIIGNSIVWF